MRAAWVAAEGSGAREKHLSQVREFLKKKLCATLAAPPSPPKAHTFTTPSSPPPPSRPPPLAARRSYALGAEDDALTLLGLLLFVASYGVSLARAFFVLLSELFSDAAKPLF